MLKWIMVCWVWLFVSHGMSAQEQQADSVNNNSPDTEQFYDSLKHKAYRHRITKLVYDKLVTDKDRNDKASFEYELLRLTAMEGKTIASVEVRQLDIVGPSFEDTTKVNHTWLGKTTNRIHTQTNEKIIRKNILIHVGDTLDVEKVLDNERIIRQLPYIKDVQFLVENDSLQKDHVHLTVLTKDVFSFGLGVKIHGAKGASLEMYNQNIWGAGHQISAKMVGHVDEEPYVGFEGFYAINNLGGNFINASLKYANTYKREGVAFVFDKEFLRTTTKWGGGLTAFWWDRADRLVDDAPIVIEDFDLNYRYFDLWAGHAFQLNRNQPLKNLQLVLSGRMRNYKFLERPEPDPGNSQYFANSNFYLMSLSLSQRNYFRDYFIYSYGITEDIPKGYLHELVVGYDNNEFTDRWYTHLYFSSGNFLEYKPSYFFASAGIGGFFNSHRYEQGQIVLNGSYISRLFSFGNKHFRQFVRMDYLLGIRRFDVEELYLSRDMGIHGFYSKIVTGKQRLNLNFESVVFPSKHILDFNLAYFGFLDLGVIGSNRRLIFKENYYAGIGAGIRIRNESLVFNTLELRLAYYPNNPPDISGVGVILEERSKSQFFDFQPRKPDMLRFE
jgi:hypothetical protein